MTSRSLSLLAAASLSLPSVSCKKSESAASSAPKEESSHLDRIESKADELVDGAKDKGSSLLAKGTSATKSLWGKGLNLGKGALARGRDWGNESLEDLRKEALDLATKAKKGIDLGHYETNQLLADIARSTNKALSTGDKLTRMMVLMLPVIGPTRRYLDARALYNEGAEQKSESKKQEARRELLIACAEAGLDIGMLGIAGSGADLVATGADKALSVLKITRSMQTLVGANLSSFDRFLDQLLADETLRTTIDGALTIDLAAITA